MLLIIFNININIDINVNVDARFNVNILFDARTVLQVPICSSYL